MQGDGGARGALRNFSVSCVHAFLQRCRHPLSVPLNYGGASPILQTLIERLRP